MPNGFLPISQQELIQDGISQPDFVYVSGDAYVDHSSFGTAIICRSTSAATPMWTTRASAPRSSAACCSRAVTASP